MSSSAIVLFAGTTTPLVARFAAFAADAPVLEADALGRRAPPKSSDGRRREEATE